MQTVIPRSGLSLSERLCETLFAFRQWYHRFINPFTNLMNLKLASFSLTGPVLVIEVLQYLPVSVTTVSRFLNLHVWK